MISLEQIKAIAPDDDDAIEEAYAELAEEMRGMKLDSDFTDINVRYDALDEIRKTVMDKFETMSPEELEKMISGEEMQMYWCQENFVKDRHPEWGDEEDTDEDVEAIEE